MDWHDRFIDLEGVIVLAHWARGPKDRTEIVV